MPQYAALYKQHINTYNREIELARNAGWQDFCTKTESVKQASTLMKILEGKKKGGRISIIEEGGNSFLSPESSLKCLMETHFEDHATQKVETVSTAGIDVDLRHVVDYIDKLKVARAISSFGPLKATGPDELRPIVLQMSSIGFVRYLTISISKYS